MGKNSAIAWTHHTFNPWVGCTQVSAGCAHCYAQAYDRRVGGGTAHRSRWGVGAPRTRTTAKYWAQPARWDAEARAAGQRHRVFCASLADVLDPAVPAAWRREVLGLVGATPHLDWLLLTKRPEYFDEMTEGRPWPENVWLGVTVEHQEQALRRIPHLLRQQVPVRFLSCEPLLGPLDLTEWIVDPRCASAPVVDWVIVGGESGGRARSFDPHWARALISQASTAPRAPAVFVKQLGSNPIGLELRRHHGADPSEWPADLRLQQFPLALTSRRRKVGLR